LKKKIIAVLITLFTLFYFNISFAEKGCYTDAVTYGIRWDRALHFQSGIIGGIVFDRWMKRYLDIQNPWIRGVFSIGVTSVFGYAKECVDRSKIDNKWWDYRRWNKDERRDFYSVVAGSMVGFALTFTF